MYNPPISNLNSSPMLHSISWVTLLLPVLPFHFLYYPSTSCITLPLPVLPLHFQHYPYMSALPLHPTTTLLLHALSFLFLKYPFTSCITLPLPVLPFHFMYYAFTFCITFTPLHFPWSIPSVKHTITIHTLVWRLDLFSIRLLTIKIYIYMRKMLYFEGYFIHNVFVWKYASLSTI